MNKVFFGRLISQATRRIQTMPVYLTRAQSNFLTVKSLDLAIEELKETQKLLEQAKEAYKDFPQPNMELTYGCKR
jgi:hypothetical protein